MEIGKKLAVSAVLGILAGACAGQEADPKGATAPSASAPPGDKHACGNHDGGSCGAHDPAPAPK
jgi:hypothetical protein